MALRNAFALLSTEAKQDAIITALGNLFTELEAKLETGQSVDVGNFPASQTVTGPLTDTELRATPVPVQDDYPDNECQADQNGADAVLTFTLSAAANFVMIDVDNTSGTDPNTYRARATLDGSDPTATTGFVCRSGMTTYLPFVTSGTVKVYAPTGVVVAVQAGGR